MYYTIKEPKSLPGKSALLPEDRLGKVRSLMVAGIKAKEYEYNFRIDGRIVQDPCAYSIRGESILELLWMRKMSIGFGAAFAGEQL